MKKLLTALLLAIPVLAYGQKKTIPDNLVDVKNVVAYLDSAVTAMYGWEPVDSTYKHSADTLTAVIPQEVYDDARVTWAEFKRLIDADKYKEAYELYHEKNDGATKSNFGDFLIFLKHSSQRYIFFSEVVRRMTEEYEGTDKALEEYINNLQLEKAMEDLTIDMRPDNSFYVPEFYPYVVRDLGMGLAITGKMDEAQDMFSDLINAVYDMTGNALYANFVGTQYSAQLYLLDQKPDWALATWESFKVYLEENKSDYEEEELSNCMAKVEDIIQGLK